MTASSPLCQEKRTQSPRTAGCDCVKNTESNGFGTQDLEANTEFRHSAFSRAVSTVRPFEVREGMEGEHTPETDLTRSHQDLEEGDRFQSSDLRFERCCFLALLRVDTHMF